VFNGTSSTGLTSLASLPLSAFSLVMWVNPVSSSLSGITISNDNTDSDSNGFYARVNGTLAVLKIGNGTTTATAFASTSLAIGSWHAHVDLRWNDIDGV
jgi:hypothetical protein